MPRRWCFWGAFSPEGAGKVEPGFWETSMPAVEACLQGQLYSFLGFWINLTL